MAEKYQYCPRCSQPLEDDGSCPGCSYGHKRINAPAKPTINPECPWNDHGVRCGKIGSLSDSHNGSGPWYCSEHFWQLKGWPIKKSVAPKVSYRERWYAERALPYEPPKLQDVGHFKCVATTAKDLLARIHSGDIGPKRQREPGDDDEVIAA